MRLAYLALAAFLGVSAISTDANLKEPRPQYWEFKMPKPRGNPVEQVYCDRGVSYEIYDSGDVFSIYKISWGGDAVSLFRMDQNKIYLGSRDKVERVRTFAAREGKDFARQIIDSCKAQRELRGLQKQSNEENF